MNEACLLISPRASGDIGHPLDLLGQAVRQISSAEHALNRRMLVPLALAQTVAKLRGARERKRKAFGKCEGRKSLAEMYPAVVREAKRLARANPKTGKRRSLRKIAAELAKITKQARASMGSAPFTAAS